MKSATIKQNWLRVFSGLENVRNLKRGEYYGDMVCKSPEQRRILGVYLLYRAMHVLLHEGERQLQPLDIAT